MHGGRLVFEVRDSGPGVPEDERERIFEPFYTKRTRGTGLGLAVAKRVVELHRGTISVDNAPGGGAIFRVALPRG
jgi:two-component system sensor histidine kinase HydH